MFGCSDNAFFFLNWVRQKEFFFFNLLFLNTFQMENKT